VTSVAQSACLRVIWGIRAIKLFIEFVVVPPAVETIFDFRVAYRSENQFLKYEQLVRLPFGQHSRLTAVEQDGADQGLVNGKFCQLQMFAQSEEAPIYSLASSLYFQTHVIRWCHQGSQIHKFFDDFKVFVTNCHALPHVTSRLIILGRNHIFCLLFIYF
jgi:hypothetical protein